MIFKKLLGLDKHADIGFGTGTDELGDICLERKEKVEVLRHFLPVHEHLRLAGDGFEMQDNPVPGPVGRHPDRPLHPRLPDLVPGHRIGREITVVRPFQAIPRKPVHIPRRRNPDPDGIPCSGALGAGLEVPVPVQAHLVAIRLLQPVGKPFRGGETAREAHPGPRGGACSSLVGGPSVDVDP